MPKSHLIDSRKLTDYPFQKICSECKYCERKDFREIDSTTWCQFLKIILHNAFKPLSCYDIDEDYKCKYKIPRNDKTKQLGIK